MGRNGQWSIRSVEVMAVAHGLLEPYVCISGISKHRKVLINGGLEITHEAMDQIAKEWIAFRQG